VLAFVQVCGDAQKRRNDFFAISKGHANPLIFEFLQTSKFV